MNITLEQAKKFQDEKKYSVLPLKREIFSDIITPVQLLKILMEASGHCFILESAGDNENWGRYTFLGYDPKLTITCKDNNVKIVSGGSVKEFVTEDPDDYIRQILNENRSPVLDNMPSFTGGLVGYFAYDHIKYFEPSLKSETNDSENFNDLDLMLFDKVIAFDNFRQKIILIVNINLTDDIEKEFSRAENEFEKIENLIKNSRPEKNFQGRLKSDFRPLFSEEVYCGMVRKAKEHIIDGDIFQMFCPTGSKLISREAS